MERRWIALGVVLLAQVMLVLDATIVTVALPTIQRDLQFSQASLTWVVDAYLIAFGSFLLVAGRLGDLAGRRRTLIAGLVLFSAASAACGLAQAAAVLVAGRFAQGVGAALASAAVLAIVTTEFPDAGDRARAMSMYVLVSVSGSSLGLLAGGVLTHAAGWHWVFFVNLPIGVAAIAAARAVVPHRPGLGLGRDVDVGGAVLVTAATAIGVLAVLRAPDEGWTAAPTLALAGASLVLFAAFAALESQLAHPILPGHVLRLPSLLGSSAVRAVMGVGSYGCFFLGALYLQRVLGYGTLRAGAAFLPQTMAVAALTLGPTAWLVRRYGPVHTTLGGLAATVAGLLVLGSADAGSGYVPAVLVAFVLLGAGGGTAILPLMTIAMRDVPPRDTGVASAIVSMSLYLPGAFGLAVLGALAADRSRTLAERGWAPVEALAAGYHLAFVVAATCVAVCLVATTALLRRDVAARSA